VTGASRSEGACGVSKKKKKCKTCKGKGYVEDTYGWVQCPDCGGYGYGRLQVREGNNRAADGSPNRGSGGEGGEGGGGA